MKARLRLGNALLISGLLGIIYHAVIILLYPIRFKIAPRMIQVYATILCKVFRINFCRVDRPKVLDQDHNGVILIANHTSFLDILILASTYKCHFVSKSELLMLPFIGTGAWLLGVRFVKRGSIKASVALIKMLSRDIRKNEVITVFPQGTTGSAAEDLPFHRGLFKVLSLNSEVIFQPISIVYQEDHKVAWGEESILENIKKLIEIGKIDVDLIAHQPMTRARLAGKSTTEIARETQLMISAELVPQL